MKRTFRQIIYECFTALCSDIKAAKWAIIFVIAYFVFFKKILYSLCPMVIFTGYPCPACGLTRATFCLLRLDFSEAFRIHPFVYAVIVYLAVFGVNRYILGRKMGKKLKWGMAVIIIAMILFYLWRMKTDFPGAPPMSYYAGNFFAQLREMIRR